MIFRTEKDRVTPMKAKQKALNRSEATKFSNFSSPKQKLALGQWGRKQSSPLRTRSVEKARVKRKFESTDSEVQSRKVLKRSEARGTLKEKHSNQLEGSESKNVQINELYMPFNYVERSGNWKISW